MQAIVKKAWTAERLALPGAGVIASIPTGHVVYPEILKKIQWKIDDVNRRYHVMESDQGFEFVRSFLAPLRPGFWRTKFSNSGYCTKNVQAARSLSKESGRFLTKDEFYYDVMNVLGCWHRQISEYAPLIKVAPSVIHVPCVVVGWSGRDVVMRTTDAVWRMGALFASQSESIRFQTHVCHVRMMTPS